MQLAELLAHYRRGIVLNRKLSTIPTVDYISRSLVRVLGPEREVEGLSASDWLGYCETRNELSSATLRHHGEMLLAAMRSAVQDGTLERVPCRIKLPPVPVRVPSVLSEEECARLFLAASRPVRPVLAAGLYCALRIGESRMLKVGDCDLERRELRVTEAKNGHGRVVPLSENALRYFAPLCGRGKDEPLFRSPRGGKHWTVTGLHAAVARAFDRADLKEYRAHVLRRTAITRMLDGGVSPSVAGRISGHRNLATLLRSYAGVRENALRDAVGRI